MRVILVFIVLICSSNSLLGLAAQADDAREKPLSAASTLYQLSWDNGVAANRWTYLQGLNRYAAVDFGTPPAAAGTFYLQSIKYAINTNWPDSIFQGYGIACWKMTSGEPGNIVWPANGSFLFNHNTGSFFVPPGSEYKWILQNVNPNLCLTTAAPGGFLVGISFLYNYPLNDAIAYDDTGIGPHDWTYSGYAWYPAPYGKNLIRAYVNGGDYYYDVEPTTLGCIRAFFR